MGDIICSTQVCGALWSLLKGRSQLGSYENYALRSFTAFEGSDPPDGLARFKVSRETALCREARNLWAIEVTVTSGSLFSRSLWLMSSVHHTHACCAACAHSNTKHMCSEIRPSNICAAHLASFMMMRCWFAMYVCLKRNVFNVPLITFCLLAQLSV